MAKQQGLRNQIIKYQTDKKLMEFLDNLVVSNEDNYAKLHNEGGDAGTFPSRVKLTMIDYSNGLGEKKIETYYNFSILELKYLYHIIKSQPKDFKYVVEKINSHTVYNGVSPVTKITLWRQEEYNGVKKNYAWQIKIENGTGVADKTDNGGTKISSGTYKKEKEVFINLNDMDMFKQFTNVIDYITLWEMAFCIPVIKKGKAKLEAQYLEAQNNKNKADSTDT